jgi:hypothetical protein
MPFQRRSRLPASPARIEPAGRLPFPLGPEQPARIAALLDERPHDERPRRAGPLAVLAVQLSEAWS